MFAAAAALAVAGCGGGAPAPTGIEISGKVVDGGQAFVIQDYASGYNYLELEFIPVDASGKPRTDIIAASTEVDEDGTFSHRVPEAGKYRVAVYRMGDTPEGEIGDIWKGKFGRDNTPFEFDIAEGDEVTIDLSQTGGGAPPRQ